LRSLAAADEQVRAPKQALRFMNKFSGATKQQNRLLEETTLKMMIAELHLGWFDILKQLLL